MFVVDGVPDTDEDLELPARGGAGGGGGGGLLELELADFLATSEYDGRPSAVFCCSGGGADIESLIERKNNLILFLPQYSADLRLAELFLWSDWEWE